MQHHSYSNMPPPITLLVGNKADLEDRRMIDVEEEDEAMKEMNASFRIYTSAKENQNVNEAFVKICEAYLERQAKGGN